VRAAIFIDGAYLLSFLKKHNTDVQYNKLAEYLLKPLRQTIPIDLLRCYFYYCAPWMSPEPTESEKRRMEEHDTFMDEITNLDRWAVRLGKLQRRWDGSKEYFEQKRVDVLLSVDMVRHSAAGHIQHVIVLAGDSDFIPAIEATKESGATVTLWYGDDHTINKDMLDLADVVHKIELRKFPTKKIKNSGKPAKSRTEKRIEQAEKALLGGDKKPGDRESSPNEQSQPSAKKTRSRKR